MSDVEVVNRIYVYEIDDNESEAGKSHPKVTISSHWNRQELVVIEIAGHTYTVNATDITKAIENATNWKSH
jgi:endonuclease V-like protein UPF0215 family